MALFACSVAILTVMAIHLFWRTYHQASCRRQCLLRERVALLLWVAADVHDADLRSGGQLRRLTTPQM